MTITLSGSTWYIQNLNKSIKGGFKCLVSQSKKRTTSFQESQLTTTLKVAKREQSGYSWFMIKSFTHKGLEKFFTKGSKASIQARHENRIRLILAQLNQSKCIEDMNIPTLRLHQLKGVRKSIWAVTVQANWRITFRFSEGDAEIVNYKDYH